MSENIWGGIDTDREKIFDDFASEVSLEKEEIPKNPFLDEFEEAEEVAEEIMDDEQEDLGSSEVSIKSYDEGHLLTAQTFLSVFDNTMGFLLSTWGGKDPKEYKKYKGQPGVGNVEVELCAALVKKYSMTMSLETMFAMAMAFAYSPLYMKARKDAKELKKKKEAEKEEQIRNYMIKRFENVPEAKIIVEDGKK